MSRRRYLTSDISTDPRIADLSGYGALPVALYLMAITHADDWGRLTGDARQFKLLVCPGFDVTAREIDEALSQIAEVGLWLRYSVEGRAYIAFPPASWFRYQTYIGRDKRASDGSAIPAPADPAWRALPASPQAEPVEPMQEPVAPTVTQEQTADNAAVRRATPRNAEDHRGTPNFAAERRETPLHARTPSPSPSPSPSPTVTSAGQGLSPERDNAREPAQADVAPVTAALAASLAADAALSLISPTPSSAASAASTAVSETPANVTPLPIAGRASSRRPAATASAREAVKAAGARVPDPVWDACIAAMRTAPSNRVERGKWAKGIQALKESLAADGSPPDEIGVRSARYRARYGAAVPLNPMALAGNWTVLAHDIPREEQRHGYGQGNVRYAQSARRAERHGGSGFRGGPAVGTPEYYAQAAAQPYYTGHSSGYATEPATSDSSDDASHTGGGAGQRVREAAQEWTHAAAE